MLQMTLLLINLVYATEMNGVSFEQYAGFEKKWHLVTVRFRNDTGEMRFTYANDKAWKVLKSGGLKFPKGAVFGKIGIGTKSDPLFASSSVPSGTRRFQLMVRDEKKYLPTNGWGYALFDAEGKLFPEEVGKQVMACYACHSVARSRADVFSEPMQLTSQLSAVATSPLHFVTEDSAAFSKLLGTLLPKMPKQIRRLVGPVTAHAFQGTLDEIRPTLAKEALKSGIPALYLADDQQKFALVIESENQAVCEKQNASDTVPMQSISTAPGGKDDPIRLDFCFAKPAN